MSENLQQASLVNRPVGQIAADIPGAALVFRDHKIDFCCAGKKTLADVASRHGLDAEALAAEIAAHPVADADAASSRATDALIDHIIERYHREHLRELPVLIEYASKVETKHAGRPGAPSGLADVLSRLLAEMRVHQQREEVILFPMMKQGGGMMVAAAIGQMRAEHEDHGAALERIDALTQNRQPPSNACATWRALYTGLTKFHDDVISHVHLENNVLFPRFEADDPHLVD